MSRLWARSPRGRVTLITSAAAALVPAPVAAKILAAGDARRRLSRIVARAGRRTPSALSARTREVIVSAQLTALVAVAGGAAWVATGRALRPVATMRGELDDANASDLSRRVTQPPGDGEVARLARSVNGTLARMERAALQQRQFASDASHELRTPVAGLRAQLESAQLYPDDTDLQALVRGALRDTDRLEAIIDDLLLLAKIGSRAGMERVDLAELVRQELAARTDQLPVQVKLSPDVTVQGVRMQLARVLTNLLDNAQRYGDSEVRVIVTREGDQAVLAVENDGSYIPVEDRERIFERFARLDAARSRDAGGTGLGLAIARDVAIAHRGQICVEDCPGHARFVLRLPAV
ncbi:sensor histidine kinase [Nonomuraea sp. ZG12]|uniref:sensor histidine kinase n=1 Tax=Nonomuraea sp. ZG12 TaxID=3452207 RepID=UPI003F89F8A6